MTALRDNSVTFYKNCRNFLRTRIDSKLSVRLQTIKMTSDGTRAICQRKITPITLERFPCYCKKQMDGSMAYTLTHVHHKMTP